MADYGNRSDRTWQGVGWTQEDLHREWLFNEHKRLGTLLDDDLVEFDVFDVQAVIAILWDWRTGEYLFFARFAGGAMMPLNEDEHRQILISVNQRFPYADIDGAEGTGVYEGCKVDVFLLDERQKARLATKRYGFLSSKPMPKVWAFLEKVEATA